VAFLVTPGRVFRAAINRRWPRRDKRSDGWIADDNHRPPSEHIPDGAGAVRATDTDRDGIHAPSVVAAAIVHPATWYVIHNRRIYSRRDRFRPRRYTGSNPHTGHIHRSTMIAGSADRNSSGYPLIDRGPQWPTLKRGADGQAVRELQALLNAHGASLVVDGDFGPATDKALRAFQRRHKVRNSVVNGNGDGIVGRYTREALGRV
jgi:hypothetical protein